jgi:hypothetical protein
MPMDEGGRETYEIRLKGRLDARWADWFDGLTLTQESDGSSVLRGSVADQAALHGVLSRVRDLGLPLVSITRTEAAQPGARNTDTVHDHEDKEMHS